MKFLKMTLAFLLVMIVGTSIFIRSGIYNPGADNPHWKVTFSLLQMTRECSVEHYASAIVIPVNLDDSKLILKGAGQYAAMCTDCHLAPGKKNTEIRPGMYPIPPDLSKVKVDPRTAFWIIKHGLKMSAMPAWGMSHDDETIWSMVAFLQKLPGMTPAQYKEMVAKAPPDDDMDSMDDSTSISHDHGHTK